MSMPIDDPMLVDDPVPSSPRIPTPEPARTAAGRPVRTKRPTWKLLQLLPEPPAPAPELKVTEPDEDATPPPGPTAFVWESIKTAMNTFGLYCEYPRVPTHDPDSTISLSDLPNHHLPLPSSFVHRPPLLYPRSYGPPTSSRPHNYSPPPKTPATLSPIPPHMELRTGCGPDPH